MELKGNSNTSSTIPVRDRKSTEAGAEFNAEILKKAKITEPNS